MDDLFSNATVAAFFGAFAAFLLVAATDLRRRYLIRSLLNRQVEDAIELAKAKLETVRMNIALVREDNRITAAPIMPFPLKPIEDYRLQVLDLLSSVQAQALDALAYWMKAIDGLLGEAIAVATRVKTLTRANAPDAERRALAEEYLELMGEAEKNMLYLLEMLQHYAANRPEKILGFKHPVGEAR
jgi:hypothetical protein